MISDLSEQSIKNLKCDLLIEYGTSGGGGGGVLLRNCTMGDTSRDSDRGCLTDLCGDSREGDLWDP